jgi:hypothetical protein
VTELRDFLIAQTAADEKSGALDEIAGREQRRAIVRHGEKPRAVGRGFRISRGFRAGRSADRDSNEDAACDGLTIR